MDGALHVGNFLGALVHQKADEMDLGVVGGDGLGNLLEHRGLTGLGGRNDKATLTLADGGNQVDDATEDGVLAMLHAQRLARENRREIAEAGAYTQLLGILAIDLGDFANAGTLLTGTRDLCRAVEHVAAAQAVDANEGSRHEQVGIAGQISLGAHDARTVVGKLKHAVEVEEALLTVHFIINRLDKGGAGDPVMGNRQLVGLGKEVFLSQGGKLFKRK